MCLKSTSPGRFSSGSRCQRKASIRCWRYTSVTACAAHGRPSHVCSRCDRTRPVRRPQPLQPYRRTPRRSRTQPVATVGVAEHANSALLVTVAPGGKFLDRRRILTDGGLPTHPHHHEGSWAVGRHLNTPGARALSLAEAVALVERVRASAARGTREGLESLAAAVPVPIASIAIRACPKLPPTTEERIADHRAQTIADSVMYREVLATAAEARGWSVHWDDREHVFRDAGRGAWPRGRRRLSVRDGSIGRPTVASQAQACGGCGACGETAARVAAAPFSSHHPSQTAWPA